MQESCPLLIMSGNKHIKPVNPFQRPNQIVSDNLENETVYNGVQSKWQDLPAELLMHILMFVDDRTVIIASGVCTGWKEAICFGVQELSLSWCKQNIDNLVLSAVPKFTRLQSLNLHQYDTHLNDQAVETVGKYCHDLRALDLSRSILLTDKALEALAHGCNLLEKLFISECTGVTDSALIILSEKCNKLSYLGLWDCFRAATDRSLLALAHNCRGLQFLNLGGCQGVTDVGITELAKCCPDLRAINLCACVKITDLCLLALAHNCRGLQFLSIRLCQKVTDIGVTGLAKCCPELRAIDLCYCSLITDQSVIALAGNSHQLRSLQLGFCKKITDSAMYSLVNNSVHRAIELNKKDEGNNNVYNSEYGSQIRRICGCGNCSKSVLIPAASDDYMEHFLNDQDDYGLELLDISHCTSLTAPAVQAVCDTFPALHPCSERKSLIICGCDKLISVQCARF